MELIVTEEFLTICEDIIKEGKQDAEWALIESDDMFQTENFVGGYDANEAAFCFSYYDENQKEFWFQLTLEEIQAIILGTRVSFAIRPAEN